MKAKSVLFILIAGFLALSACSNPILAELYNTNEGIHSPEIPTTGNSDIEDPPTVIYTVAFDTNGGSPVDCQTVGENGSASRPENPIKSGYGFVNWYDNETLAKPHYDFDTPVTGDITLFAEWSRIFHTVIFDSKGGSAVDSLSVGENGTASRPENPTKSGYGFVNWYDNEGLSEPHYDFDTPVTRGITLYAKWNQIFHTVIFDSKGGSSVDSLSVGENGTASRPENPTKHGYGFVNWYDNEGLSEPHYDFDTPVICGITLYAKWMPKTYTITFMDGDTELSELTQTVTHGNTVNRPDDPSKDGYVFDDWYGDTELSDVYDFDTPVTDNTTVYAKFNIKTYTVTFMDGDTELAGLTRTLIPHGSTVSRPETNPTKNGYIFVNWYSDPELTAVYDFDTPVTDNTTVYAKFNIGTYTVTFMDGGTVLSGFTRNNIPHGSTIDRPATDPTKDGYTFDDWYSNSGLTTLFSFSTPVTDNTTVYAKFNIRTYTVTFMDGDTVLSALTQTVAHGSTINRPSDPIKDGYDIFDNWYADSVLVTSFNFSTPIIGNKTVYSRWLDSDFPGEVIYNPFNVSNATEWNNAVDIISRGGDNKNYIINVIADFSVSSTAFNHFGAPRGIKVSLRGVGRTMTWTGKGNILRINSGQTLILRDLTLRGNKSNSESLVLVWNNNGTFIMQSGKICGNSSGWYAGGVGVETGGIFIMNGGEISDNEARNGGGVNVYDGTFTMNGGIISLNSAVDGGGVNVDEDGTFAMYGGIISRNVATYSGAGVYVFGKSFTMYGGEISNNNSAASSSNNGGGGVLVDWGTTFRIVTGTIYGYNHPSLSNYANLADDNSGAALLMRGGTAQYGKFNGTTWVSSGNLSTTNNTIKVVNGVLQP